jgi:tetratricopeptide (TPR) repeat protein
VEIQLRALEIEPGSGRVRMNYATTLKMLKRTAEALHEARRAMAGEPRHPVALMQFGWILLSAGEVQEARQVAEAALAQDDSSGPAHYLLGVICCDHLGDLSRAIEEFGKAIARGGDMGTFYRSLGIARRKKGDLPGALEAFHKAAENRQGVARARVWNDLAWFEKDAGDWTGAIHACRQALAAAPDWINPRNLLAWLLADCPDPALRNLDEAQRLAEEAVTMRPQGPFALLMLGLARYRAGRFEEAAQVLETSVRGLETEEALWLLAMAHAKLGNGEAARQWAERARRHVRPPQRKALDILADYRAEAEQVLEETGR